MISIPNLKSSRSMRLVVATISSSILLCLIYLYWNWRESPWPPTSNASNPHNLPPCLPPSEPRYASNDSAIWRIPDKVWHSAKDEDVSDQQRAWINSWTKTNPSCRQELLTDRSAEQFVSVHFHNRPDIVEVYKAIPIPILRADLLRYLIILAEGGYWSDLDVSPDKPNSDWVPAEYKHHNIDMIVGIEFDFAYRGPGTEVASQFCNWVFAAQPSSRNLQIIVDSVVSKLKEIAEANDVHVSGIKLEMLKDVVNVTGPKIMTIAILESLGQLLGRTVDDRDFSGIKHPKLIGDVLIMPGVSFAASQNGYPTDQGDALVTHHYEGSWKQADAEAKAKKKQKGQQ